MTLVLLDVVANEASERQAASLIRRDRIKNPESWDPPSADKENEIIESKGWEVYGRWFLGRKEGANPESKDAYEYPYSSDFANVDWKGLVAIRERAGQTKETTILDAAGRLMGLVEEPEAIKTSTLQGSAPPSRRLDLAPSRKEIEEKEQNSDEGYEGMFFSGSPKSKYGTHGSKGFKGDYANAWRIHFSQVGGGKISGSSTGAIRGTIRRVAMIAGGMKPKCAVVSSEGIKPRSGGKSPLSGDFSESPGDYGLKSWAKPSDDDLTQKDIQLTCSDLNVIKKAASAEIAWRAAQREKAASRSSSFRIAFRRRAGKYEIDVDSGIIHDVSLIQLGEARGHAIFIDEGSLDSALVALGESNLPAYVTHEGAVDSDRLLNEIGVFSEFYLEDGKLKAKNFAALSSFMADDPKRYRRLFDLATEAPDAFGISLVFDADLVWTYEDGTEKPIGDADPSGSIRKIPSVRFRTISSADFVDAPAANDDGLFQSKPDNSPRTLRDIVRDELKLQAEDTTMAAEATKTEETSLEEGDDQLAKREDYVEEEELQEEAAEEETSEDAEEGELDEQEEIDKLRDDIGKHADRLDMLEDGIADLKAKLGEEASENEELAQKNKQLTELVAGEDPLEENPSAELPDANLIDRFTAASGTEQTILWNENKQEILASLRR